VLTTIKKALRREPGYPVGVAAPCYLVCDCGEKLSLPVVAGMPLTYICACGTEYDARGYVVKGIAN